MFVNSIHSVQCSGGGEIEIRSASWGKSDQGCQPNSDDIGVAEDK